MDVDLPQNPPQMLIIPIGIQGSGKTYTALNLRELLENPKIFRSLNRASFDDIVTSISGYGNFKPIKVPVYASAVRGIIYASLLMGFNVYPDMMNLTSRQRLLNIQPASLIRDLAQEGILKVVYEQHSLSKAINVLASHVKTNTKNNSQELERIAFYVMDIINTKKETPEEYESFMDNLEALIDRVSNLKIVGLSYEILIDTCWERFLQGYEHDRDKQAYTKEQWWQIIQNSIRKYEPPSISEGFDKIVHIKTHETALENIVKALSSLVV